MDREVSWTESALTDLETAAQYIARDSPGYAAVLTQEFMDAARSLELFAERGPLVREAKDPTVRELFVGSCMSSRSCTARVT